MRMKFTFRSLLVAASLLVGSVNALAEELQLTSSESAYVDAANAGVNYNGASLENLQIYNTQYRDWGSTDGTVKMGDNNNPNGKAAFYKFDLSQIKSLGGTVTAITFTVTGNSAASNGPCGTVRTLGYNAEWDASTITAGNITNNTGSILGTINDTGSFQPLDSKDAFTFPWGGATIEANALTYVNSVLEANKEYVTIVVTANNTRGGTVETTAKLNVTYTTSTVYNVTFSETNGVPATIEIDGYDVTSGTKLDNGTYNFTAKAVGYFDYEGQFTVNGEDINVTFTMTEKQKYSYTVYAKTGDVVLETLASDSYYADEQIYYYFKQVINYNGTLYKASSISDAYKTSFVLDSDNKVVNHTYSQPETPITNIVFLAEGEDVFSRGTGSTADTRCSMGAGGYAVNKTAFVTLPAGKYYLVISNRCSGNRTGIHNFYKGEDVDPFFAADGNGYNAERKSEEFTLTETTTLYMQGGSDNQYVDWLYIYGTPDNVSITISEAGYSTFSSNYAVSIPEELTAYIATSTDVNGEYEGTITLQEVTGTVAANTGLLLKGDADQEYKLPVSAEEGESYDDDNLLKPTAANGKVAKGNYIFAYNNSDASECGFYYLDNEVEVGAGKAYLEPKKDTSEIKTFRFVFDGSTATAIEAVESADADAEGAIYNVAGQQVGKDYKGIVIKNGKKYLNK